jgi:hypothetical protein
VTIRLPAKSAGRVAHAVFLAHRGQERTYRTPPHLRAQPKIGGCRIPLRFSFLQRVRFFDRHRVPPVPRFPSPIRRAEVSFSVPVEAIAGGWRTLLAVILSGVPRSWFSRRSLAGAGCSRRTPLRFRERQGCQQNPPESSVDPQPNFGVILSACALRSSQGNYAMPKDRPPANTCSHEE